MPEKHDSSVVIKVIDEGRVVGFSDAVFAFAITLLVLKLDLPQVQHELANTQLFKALLDLWPQYLSNIISFIVIGMFWVSHHRLLRVVKRFDMTFIWLNLILLMGISFIPFPTDLLGEYGDTRIAVAFYYLTLSFVGILQLVIWMYASYNRRLISTDISKAHIHLYTIRSLMMPVIFLYCFLMTYINLKISTFSWLLIFVIPPLFSHYWKEKHNLSNY